MEHKDRFGDKLRDVEKAREDQYAAERDRELIEKLRKKQEELRQAASKAADKMGMLCPRCHRELEPRSFTLHHRERRHHAPGPLFPTAIASRAGAALRSDHHN